MIDKGMRVSPLVCSTRNMICALLAVSFTGFRVCRLSMAFKPKGVAALSSPSILALKFITICPMAGCLSGTSGNRRFIKGFRIRARKLTAPAFSPMFISPIKNTMAPVKGRPISITEDLEASKMPSTSFLKIS